MADLDAFHAAPQFQLMEHIKDARCVMLGAPDPELHMQPMAPQVDPELGSIVWFFSDNTSELGKAVIASPGTVTLAHIGKDYQASVRGRLEVETDRTKVDHFWNTVAASWYPKGKKDPKLLMLRFSPYRAGVWATDKSFLGFAYETAKANLTKTLPDVGEHKEIIV